MTVAPDDRLRRTAEQRVGARISFRIHVFVYLLVNSGLVLLNVVTSPNYLWCLWSIFGWGVGLAAHGYAVYGIVISNRERMIEDELVRLRRDRAPKP